MGDRGYVMILTLLVMAGLLLLGLFLLDHFLYQMQINYNLYLELKTYFLAQAGLEYAAYRLENEPLWRTDGWIKNLGSAGQFKIIISEDTDYLIVQSCGIYRNFVRWRTGYFSRVEPIYRVK